MKLTIPKEQAGWASQLLNQNSSTTHIQQAPKLPPPLRRQPCRRRSGRRSPCWRRRSVAGRRCLRLAGVAAEAGPHDPVDALARQDEDVLAVVLPEREDVTEQRVGAAGGGLAGDRRALGAGQGYHGRGVVPAALRGLCAGPHQRRVEIGVEVPARALADRTVNQKVTKLEKLIHIETYCK